MNSKSKKGAALAVLTATLAVAATITIAFLTDYRRMDNVFKIGSVDLLITETNYPNDPSQRVMYSGSLLDKNPKVTNTGSSDEYVFMTVSVPKYAVTLLNDDGTKTADGNTVSDAKTNPQMAEIFRLISNASDGRTITLADNSNIQYDADWICLTSYNTESDNYNTYVFGYTKRLLSSDNAQTAEDYESDTLFDRIQLKSFIEGEIPEDAVQNIEIRAYGIGADNLQNVEGVTNETTVLNETQLETIYGYFTNQTGS